MSSAVVSLLWENHTYSKIKGEAFADVPGVGRFSIRRSKHDENLFELKLNGSLLLRSNTIDMLKSFAQAKLAFIMRRN
jgi:hypothetical protein